MLKINKLNFGTVQYNTAINAKGKTLKSGGKPFGINDVSWQETSKSSAQITLDTDGGQFVLAYEWKNNRFEPKEGTLSASPTVNIIS